MKHKALQIIGWCFVVLIGPVGCDVFQEDQIPITNQVKLNKSATDFYTIPYTPVVMDLRSLVATSFAKGTLKISQDPSHGKVTPLGDYLVKYQPNNSFESGKDQFQIALITGEEIIKNETLNIYVVKDASDFPCSLYAVGDLVYTKPDSSLSIKILSNDIICSVDKETIKISFHSTSKHGEALLVDDSIKYSPEPGFSGADEIVYKLTGNTRMTTGATDSTITSFGIMTIIIGEKEPCYSFNLNNDFLKFAIPPDDFEHVFEFSVVDNDELCFDNPSVTIIDPPSRGTAQSLGNGKIRYTGTYAEPVSFGYEICSEEICKRASVNLEFIFEDGDAHRTYIWAMTHSSLVVGLGIELWKEKKSGVGDFEFVTGSEGGGGSVIINLPNTEIPDGKYKVKYDVKVDDYNRNQDIIYTINVISPSFIINENSKAAIFYGKDSKDLLNGPAQVQYFEKKGNNISFSSIESIPAQPVDLTFDLTWDSGDGTPGDVDLDLLLYQCKICLPGMFPVYLVGKSERQGAIFEFMKSTLGSDDVYNAYIIYNSGTSNNVSATLTLSTTVGTFNKTEKLITKSLQFSLASKGLPPCGLEPCQNPMVSLNKRDKDLTVSP